MDDYDPLRGLLVGLIVSAVLWVVAIGAVFYLAGCQKAACPGYERVTTGSNCKSLETHLYVPLVKCDECERR